MTIKPAVVGNAVERGDMSSDTTANWVAVNPVLLKNEQATDTTTGDVRVGNGTTPYLTLPSALATTDAKITANNTTERAAQSATYSPGGTAGNIAAADAITYSLIFGS